MSTQSSERVDLGLEETVIFDDKLNNAIRVLCLTNNPREVYFEYPAAVGNILAEMKEDPRLVALLMAEGDMLLNPSQGETARQELMSGLVKAGAAENMEMIKKYAAYLEQNAEAISNQEDRGGARAVAYILYCHIGEITPAKGVGQETGTEASRGAGEALRRMGSSAGPTL